MKLKLLSNDFGTTSRLRISNSEKLKAAGFTHGTGYNKTFNWHIGTPYKKDTLVLSVDPYFGKASVLGTDQKPYIVIASKELARFFSGYEYVNVEISETDGNIEITNYGEWDPLCFRDRTLYGIEQGGLKNE